jgi:hypothetical protein
MRLWANIDKDHNDFQMWYVSDGCGMYCLYETKSAALADLDSRFEKTVEVELNLVGCADKADASATPCKPCYSHAGQPLHCSNCCKQKP